LYKIILFSLIFSTLYAKENYILKYTPDNKLCQLTQNGVKIDLFDKRFSLPEPKNSYQCAALRKEHYKDCKMVENNNTTATTVSYGVYEDTNLVVAFKVDENSTLESRIELLCE